MAGNWRRMVPLAVYVALIFIVSVLPPAKLPAPEFAHQDKLLHFAEYLVLGVLLFRGVRWEISLSRWATFGFLLSVAAMIGALSEFAQGAVPSRHMSLGDWLADLAGAAVGIALFTFTRLGGSPGGNAPRQKGRRP